MTRIRLGMGGRSMSILNDKCQQPLPLKLSLSLGPSLSMHDPMLSLSPSLSMHELLLSLSMLVLDPNHLDWAC